MLCNLEIFPLVIISLSLGKVVEKCCDVGEIYDEMQDLEE